MTTGRFGWAILGTAALTLYACQNEGPEEPIRVLHSLVGQVSGSESRSLKGTSDFEVSANPYAGGAVEFTLVASSRSSSGVDFLTVHGAGELPTVGTHPITLRGIPYRVVFSHSAHSGPASVAYVADDGEITISRATPESVEGTLRFSAFRYCHISMDGVREGPCAIPLGPIAGVARVEMSGSFSAVPVNSRPVQSEVRLGTIWFYAEPVSITVPDTVQVGTPIRIAVRTYGNGCVSRERTDLTAQERVVTVQPMDRELVGGACTDILRSIEHVVETQFVTPGIVRVVIRGRSEPSRDPIQTERTVVVR